MILPATVKHPLAFFRAAGAGNDGVFDWTWTQGCFAGSAISPMDIDAVVERNGNFLMFETKGIDVPIPHGQLITLKQFHALGCVTVMLIQGKISPEKTEVWFPGDKKELLVGQQETKNRVSSWYRWASANPYIK
jgi:hypothetical protein